MDVQTAREAVKFLGETVGFWIQTGALFISAVAAIWLIYDNGRSERRRAIIDLVLHQQEDTELQAAIAAVRELRDNNSKSSIAKYLDDGNSDPYKHIIRLLNHYEFIAAGIAERAFDEKLYKRMQCTVLVRNWRALSGFVEEFRNRKGSQTLYQEFQKLGKKWERRPLKKDHG